VKRLLFVCALPLVGLTALAACDAVGNSDSRSTENALNTDRVETAIFAGTQAATVLALQATVDNAPLLATQLSQLEREKESLEDTIEAVTTRGIIAQPQVSPQPGSSTNNALPSSPNNYRELQTSVGIDPATGCPTSKQGRFGVNEDMIYLNAVGIEVATGTAHRARWYREGELRYESEEWVADQTYPEICIYFWLEPSYTPFEPGLWSVELLVNNEALSPVPFEICVAGELC
jgi:hypothetical protein